MFDSLKRYSSQVTIILVISGSEFDVAQVASGTCYLRNPSDVEPGNGELIINVDGRETRHKVFIPHGIQSGQREVSFF